MHKELVNILGNLIFCICGYFSPIGDLIAIALLFLVIDFITGNIADGKRKHKRGRKYRFESKKAWRTIWKTIGVLFGISMAWIIDAKIITFIDLNLANVFTAFVCGVEFWSWLENMAFISESPIFLTLKKIAKSTIKRKTDIDLDESCTDQKDKKQ